MIRAEWTVNALSGPIVGSATSDSIGGALHAMWVALRQAGLNTTGHDIAIRQLRTSLVAKAPEILREHGRVEYSATAVRVVLTEVGE